MEKSTITLKYAMDAERIYNALVFITSLLRVYGGSWSAQVDLFKICPFDYTDITGNGKTCQLIRLATSTVVVNTQTNRTS